MWCNTSVQLETEALDIPVLVETYIYTVYNYNHGLYKLQLNTNIRQSDIITLYN